MSLRLLRMSLRSWCFATFSRVFLCANVSCRAAWCFQNGMKCIFFKQNLHPPLNILSFYTFMQWGKQNSLTSHVVGKSKGSEICPEQFSFSLHSLGHFFCCICRPKASAKTPNNILWVFQSPYNNLHVEQHPISLTELRHDLPHWLCHEDSSREQSNQRNRYMQLQGWTSKETSLIVTFFLKFCDFLKLISLTVCSSMQRIAFHCVLVKFLFTFTETAGVHCFWLKCLMYEMKLQAKCIFVLGSCCRLSWHGTQDWQPIPGAFNLGFGCYLHFQWRSSIAQRSLTLVSNNETQFPSWQANYQNISSHCWWQRRKKSFFFRKYFFGPAARAVLLIAGCERETTLITRFHCRNFQNVTGTNYKLEWSCHQRFTPDPAGSFWSRQEWYASQMIEIVHLQFEFFFSLSGWRGQAFVFQETDISCFCCFQILGNGFWHWASFFFARDKQIQTCVTRMLTPARTRCFLTSSQQAKT